MSTMAGVWVSAEHQCAIWCNQLASKLGSMIVEESQQLLNSLQWPAQRSILREPHQSASALLSDGRTIAKVYDVSSETRALARTAVLNTYQRLQQLWKASKYTSRPLAGAKETFWGALDPILLSSKKLQDDAGWEAPVSLSCDRLLLQHPKCVLKLSAVC